MCHALDSLPPVPPIAGAAVTHELLTLHAGDRTDFSALAAVPDGGRARAGVVILPDVRGLYRFYQELALRFAERDIAAAAIDYFGRTAGTGERGEDFDYWPHVVQTTPQTVQADAAAAAEHLRSAAGC